MNVQEVQLLKQQIDNTNERLVYAKAQIESSKQRQREILAEYGCNSIEELQQLVINKEAEMAKLVNAAKEYLGRVQPIIQQVESVVNNVGN